MDHLKHVDAPQWMNPLRAPAHRPPPEQENSRSGDASWFSDFNWRHPFSSSLVFDEERAVLPPLPKRPPVYTYFDITGHRKDEKSRKAELELLQMWRRAWWAQGFRPVVLGKAEATKNPLYKRVENLNLKPDLKFEVMRWLAWGHMGSGILCNWLAVPMAHYDDELLSFLRGGEYHALIRYQDLENGLFVGPKDAIDGALRSTLDSSNLGQAQSIIDVASQGTFEVVSEHEGVAFYSSKVIQAHYPTIREKLEKEGSRADGLALLPSLINSHLHNTWQNWFSSGIAVLKPIAKNTTSMVEPALDIGTNLSQCAYSPIPASCPPNRPNCKPCVSSQPMRVLTPPVFRNESTLFTIATVPHPYTLQSLVHTKDDLNIRYIRRNTTRDDWILAATKELLGTGKSSYIRLPAVKSAVASDYGNARSLWLTAEQPLMISNAKDLEELDWILGFQIARHPLKSGKSETPVPGPERRPPPPKQEFDGPTPPEEQLRKQKTLVENARVLVQRTEKGSSPMKQVRDVMEAWNLADTEAWKFVRAFNARRTMDRRKWEDEEKAFVGKDTYDRWKEFVGGS